MPDTKLTVPSPPTAVIMVGLNFSMALLMPVLHAHHHTANKNQYRN